MITAEELQQKLAPVTIGSNTCNFSLEKCQELAPKINKINQLKKDIIKLERKIDTLSEILKRKDENLSDPKKFKDLVNDKDFFLIYDEENKKLKSLERDWESKNEELEKLIILN